MQKPRARSETLALELGLQFSSENERREQKIGEAVRLQLSASSKLFIGWVNNSRGFFLAGPGGHVPPCATPWLRH